MSPLGTRVIVQNKPGNHTSWGYNGKLSCYIGSYLDHYICMKCYTSANDIVRITDTLKYILKSFASTKATSENYLQQAIGNIFEIMK